MTVKNQEREYHDPRSTCFIPGSITLCTIVGQCTAVNDLHDGTCRSELEMPIKTVDTLYFLHFRTPH